MSILGIKIKQLRKEQGLTLDELAAQTGSSKSYIWELENRSVTRPSADKLAKIAEVLDTTLEYLLDEGGNIEEEDARDARFYREYRGMDAAVKAKIRKMVKIWGRDG